MKTSHRLTSLVALTGTASLVTLAAMVPAHADYAPGPNDIVGVGGDTPQYDLSFGANGDVLGDPGFNSANDVNKLVTFDAVADGNARAAYAQGSTEAAPIPLNPTVVLREGTSPVQRVQSSGAAITALLADTAKQETINFVFSASKPTAAQQAQAATNGWGYLHVVQIAKDAVEIAAAKTTNAPAGLSIAELLSIYTGKVTKWNQLPGNSSGSSDTIVPLLPPSSSSITKTFLADLKTANGGTAPTLAASVKTVEQNDPTAITGASAPADAIVPFSSARLNLYTSGYFHNSATAFPGGTAIDPGAALLTGTPGDGGTAYSSEVDHFVIFRQSDATSKTPMEPGSSLNWVETLFSDPSSPATPFFAKKTGQALIAAAGATPVYADLGNVSSG
ncbi:MAG TPA: substrate-binding domain-containing protein [Mycobacteriales bacterium]|nr:substrate-binding domain-containing protein [Mycobacteriales bacterium]